MDTIIQEDIFLLNEEKRYSFLFISSVQSGIPLIPYSTYHRSKSLKIFFVKATIQKLPQR